MYYGQWETDRIIEKYFTGKKTGQCIEVGAYNGIKGSNSKYFEDIGWDCLCIEPNPFVFEELLLNRSKSKCSNYACDNFVGESELEIYTFKSGTMSSLTSLQTDIRLTVEYKNAIESTKKVNVGVTTLNKLIQQYVSKHIDFISIDTEGTELDVLRGLDLSINKPTLLIVENNYNDQEITDYLMPFDYIPTERYYVNNFYIKTTRGK